MILHRIQTSSQFMTWIYYYSFSFETIMFAVVYFRQSLRLSHSVSPL